MKQYMLLPRSQAPKGCRSYPSRRAYTQDNEAHRLLHNINTEYRKSHPDNY